MSFILLVCMRNTSVGYLKPTYPFSRCLEATSGPEPLSRAYCRVTVLLFMSESITEQYGVRYGKSNLTFYQ